MSSAVDSDLFFRFSASVNQRNMTAWEFPMSVVFLVLLLLLLLFPFPFPFPPPDARPSGPGRQCRSWKPGEDRGTSKRSPISRRRARGVWKETKRRKDDTHEKTVNSTNPLQSFWTEILSVQWMPSNPTSLPGRCSEKQQYFFCKLNALVN
jgi:hypothetical protein